MERRKIKGLTVFFCTTYKCWLTKQGCEHMQRRSKLAQKLFLTNNPPETKSEINFVLDPLVFSSDCPCNSPISSLESN